MPFKHESDLLRVKSRSLPGLLVLNVRPGPEHTSVMFVERVKVRIRHKLMSRGLQVSLGLTL